MRYPRPRWPIRNSELTSRMKESASALPAPARISGSAAGSTTSPTTARPPAADAAEPHPRHEVLQGGDAVADEIAGAQELPPRGRHRAQRRQLSGIDEIEARRRFPYERQQEERQITGEGLHPPAPVCVWATS